MANACVFCGDDSRRLTDQHIFGDWVGECFGREVEGLSQIVDGSGNVTQWPSAAFSDVVKVVCEGCNTGWMERQIEKPVQATLGPMMTKGWSTSLSVRTQKALADWAVLQALMLAHLHPRHPVIPTSEYARFYAAKSALPANLVWIGRRNSAGIALASSLSEAIDNVQIPNSDPEAAAFTASSIHEAVAAGEGMYRVTFAVGFVVFQVFGHTFTGPMVVEGGSALAPAVHRIWPSDRQVLWPPSQGVETIGGLRGLHKAWGGDGGPRTDTPLLTKPRPTAKSRKARKKAKRDRKRNRPRR
jgi:hypothetical protein